MTLPPWTEVLVAQLTTFGLKLLGAIRRVELAAQLYHSVDPEGAIKLLREHLARIPDVATTPAPEVEILQFTAAGPVLAVRPCCNNDAYWQVYFDTNRAIRETFSSAGYPAPEQLVFMRSGTAG
jgi:small conductance mechanosensitive channel